MLWFAAALAQADTGCFEVPGRFVDGLCVQPRRGADLLRGPAGLRPSLGRCLRQLSRSDPGAQ